MNLNWSALGMYHWTAKTLFHIRLLLLLPVHISCYEQLNSIDFVWLFADRPALQFLAAASRRPAESLQRHLLSSSTILLQNLSCLKSILPPSNDRLKMNAEKTDPLFMPTLLWLSGLYLDQRWQMLERYLLSHCHGVSRSAEEFWLNGLIGLCLNIKGFSFRICHFPTSYSSHLWAGCWNLCCLIGFQALLPTRRWFNTMLDDSHMVVRCHLSGLVHREEEGHLFCQVRSRKCSFLKAGSLHSRRLFMSSKTPRL